MPAWLVLFMMAVLAVLGAVIGIAVGWMRPPAGSTRGQMVRMLTATDILLAVVGVALFLMRN